MPLYASIKSAYQWRDDQHGQSKVLMQSQYKLYCVQVSLFAGKVRGYLNYKGLDYQEKAPTLHDMLRRFPKKVGATVSKRRAFQFKN